MDGDDFGEDLASLYGLRSDHTLLVIVPSERVTGEEFLDHLRSNGIESEALASGTGRVVDQEGIKYRVSGTIVGSVDSSDTSAVEKIAKLCGVTVVIFD